MKVVMQPIIVTFVGQQLDQGTNAKVDRIIK